MFGWVRVRARALGPANFSASQGSAGTETAAGFLTDPPPPSTAPATLPTSCPMTDSFIQFDIIQIIYCLSKLASFLAVFKPLLVFFSIDVRKYIFVKVNFVAGLCLPENTTKINLNPCSVKQDRQFKDKLLICRICLAGSSFCELLPS